MNDPLLQVYSALGRFVSSAICIVLVGTSGCEDPNKMFEGVWKADGSLPDLGEPVLAIGHFGLDLTGLVYFQPAPGKYDSTCPCALIEQDIGDTIDFDGREISFISSCLESFDPNTGTRTFSDLSFSWSLTMGEEEPDPGARTLWGQVVKPESEPAQVQFTRSSLSVSDKLKQCPPEGWCDQPGHCEAEGQAEGALDIGDPRDDASDTDAETGPAADSAPDAALQGADVDTHNADQMASG